MRAVFSLCGLYRYMLEEPGEHQAAWVMLNPSRAGSKDVSGATVSDPTANKVAGFSRDWGYSGWIIVNAGAFVATDPTDWAAAADPYGSDNDAYLHAVATMPLKVVAWGKNCPPDVATRVLGILGPDVWCLGHNINGSPKHPLYIPYSARLVRYDR